MDTNFDLWLWDYPILTQHHFNSLYHFNSASTHFLMVRPYLHDLVIIFSPRKFNKDSIFFFFLRRRHASISCERIPQPTLWSTSNTLDSNICVGDITKNVYNFNTRSSWVLMICPACPSISNTTLFLRKKGIDLSSLYWFQIRP